MLSKTPLLVSSALWLSRVATAVLPPDSTEELKATAEEVLTVYVTSSELTSYDVAVQNFEIEATVVDVTRSETQLSSEDKPSIQFDSYFVYNSTGFVGPKSPPLLPRGWCGKVYLNPASSDGDGEDAAEDTNESEARDAGDDVELEEDGVDEDTTENPEDAEGEDEAGDGADDVEDDGDDDDDDDDGDDGEDGDDGDGNDDGDYSFTIAAYGDSFEELPIEECKPSRRVRNLRRVL